MIIKHAGLEWDLKDVRELMSACDTYKISQHKVSSMYGKGWDPDGAEWAFASDTNSQAWQVLIKKLMNMMGKPQ